MKKIIASIIIMALMLGLCACSRSTATWQEQYDLGVRYLSEGNYREAIIAFTAAIEIDPKQAPAYVGRGNAYILTGETEQNLAAAKADYEKAIELDETIAEAYLGLADVYIRQGEYERAIELLRIALEKTDGNQSVANKLAEMEGGMYYDTSGRTRRSSYFQNGELIQYWLYEYDEFGNNTITTGYYADGTWERTEISEFDEKGQEIRMTATYDDHSIVETYEYDISGRRIRETRVNSFADGQNHTTYTIISYDDTARTETHDEYDEQDQLIHRFIIEHDEQGIQIKGSNYIPDENGTLHLNYYVTYIWNEDGSYGGFNHYQVADNE